MRAIVTGAGGFVGRHLVALLAERGFEVVRTVRPDEPDTSSPGDRTFPVELSDRDAVGRLLDAVETDVVFHLAAQSHVGRSLGEQLAATVIGAVQMATYLAHGLCDRGSRARFIHVSTGESYGAAAARGPCLEETVPEPLSPYGAGKRASEEIILQAVRARGFDAVIARPFNHLGRGQSREFLVPSLARQLLTNLHDGVATLAVGDLSTVRDYSDVRDVVRGYVLLAEQGVRGGIYNLSSGEGRTGFQILERLARIAGVRAETTVDPARLRKADVPSLVGDSSKIRALGWTPRYALDETLAEVLADAR